MRDWFGRGAVGLAFSVCCLAVSATEGVRIVGGGSTQGTVRLNGIAITGGAVVLGDKDRLETGRDGFAILTISPTDRIALDHDSSVVLAGVASGVSAQLERGRILVSAAHDHLQEIRLAGEAISIRGPRGSPRRYQVTAEGNATYVYARAGSVSIFDEGYATQTEVPEGRVGTVRPEAELLAPPQGQNRPPAAGSGQRPTSSGRRAGMITASIPKDFILRAGQQAEVGLRDEVQWNDYLVTEPQGRVRLVLDDGSILSVGSASRLHVVEHNVQSQQTSLELRAGRMRAQVAKLAVPGSRFEVRTNTVVCGVLGTDFYIEATEKSTKVIVFKGIVKVTPLVAGAAAGIAVAVTAGHATSAAAGSASAPAATSASQVQGALTSTSASQGAAQAATAATVGATTATRVTLATVIPGTVAAGIAVPTVVLNNPSPSKP